MFGKLTWDAVPLHDPIVVVTLLGMVLGGVALLGAVTYFKLWGVLWRDWFTTVDHKKIGIMYIVVALVMLVRGFADALMMRAQLAAAGPGSDGCGVVAGRPGGAGSGVLEDHRRDCAGKPRRGKAVARIEGSADATADR